jgi:hypothetical protein
MESVLFSLVPFALFVAIIVTAYEMRASLDPPSCSECAHCQALAAERERRDQELQSWYARSNRIDADEEDDRRIG